MDAHGCRRPVLNSCEADMRDRDALDRAVAGAMPSFISPQRSASASMSATCPIMRPRTMPERRSCLPRWRAPMSCGSPSRARWWSMARDSAAVRSMARSRPAPRNNAALAAGKFEPPCPICGRSLETALVCESAPLDPRNAYATSKMAQEYYAANWARTTGGMRRRLALPQCVRTRHAARHALCRRRRHLHLGLAAGRGAKGVRGRTPAARFRACAGRGVGDRHRLRETTHPACAPSMSAPARPGRSGTWPRPWRGRSTAASRR